MSKEMINEITGEIVEAKNIQIVSIASPSELKFKTNYTDNAFNNQNEVNSGEYIIDDSQYIDFKKLLLDSAKRSKSAMDFLSDIPVVDDVGGLSEQKLDETINKVYYNHSVDKSADLSTSEVESPQEANETSNPVDKSPDVSAQAETNGN